MQQDYESERTTLERIGVPKLSHDTSHVWDPWKRERAYLMICWARNLGQAWGIYGKSWEGRGADATEGASVMPASIICGAISHGRRRERAAVDID